MYVKIYNYLFQFRHDSGNIFLFLEISVINIFSKTERSIYKSKVYFAVTHFRKYFRVDFIVHKSVILMPCILYYIFPAVLLT